MFDKILKAFRYYVLRELMVLQFGENDFRVCRYSSLGYVACLHNPVCNELLVNTFWHIPSLVKDYATFESASEAQQALVCYNQSQRKKPTYPKKGKFV